MTWCQMLFWVALAFFGGMVLGFIGAHAWFEYQRAMDIERGQ